MEELVLYGTLAAAGASGPRNPQKMKSGQQNHNNSSIVVCDLHSGTPYQTFKNVSLPRGSTLQAVHATSDRVFSVQHNSSVLLVYHWGRDSAVQTIVLPEKLAVVKVSPSGNWLIGGAQTGRIYIWEVMSGNLVAVREKHYQEVTVIEFGRDDDSFVFTGSKDSTVLGWRLYDLVNSGECQPVYSWNKVHSLEITGVRLGYGLRNVYTSSLDNTLRCWDLERNELVSTYILPEKIKAIAMDPSERAVYAGLINGDIIIVNRYKLNPTTGMVEGPKGNNEKVTLTYQDNSDILLTRPDSDTKASVTCLDISFDGTVLAAGYSDGQAYTWDITTKQVLRKLAPQKEAVSSIQIVSRSRKVIPGGIKLTGNNSNMLAKKKNDTSAEIFKLPIFKRILDEKEIENHNVWVKLADAPKQEVDDLAQVKVKMAKFLHEPRFIASAKVSKSNVAALTGRVKELEAQLQRAKDLKQAKEMM
ncbi:hypothetical protein DV451_004952 [Geotrichum candidum]|uniref:Pre-rRNA-processing protein IPI3 n=1 Tax=Geotrichum candidum TaxID=1173061 RepID=A0A9P5KQA4_GEOCN|nr:hypothetical protein DV451_004952 [Geotrichum candidum]KAF5105231.1 hypothetical protein DV453_005039 [Geotrichum candidum]